MNIKCYFNESCKICRTEINHYKKINASITWIDVIKNKKALEDTQSTPKELIRRLHVIKNGRIFKGIDAFLIVWTEIPRYRILAKLASLPIIYHVGWLIYEFIAILLYYKNKYLLKEMNEK